MQHLNTSKKEEEQNEGKRNLAISIPPQQYEYEPLAKSNLVSPATQENENDKMGEMNLLRESKSKLRKARTMEVNAHSEVKDMTQVDRNKRTVLHRAAIDQNVDLIDNLCDRAEMSRLMELEAFVNLRDASGNTALSCACVYNGDFGEEKRSECIKVLLDNRADPNLANQRTLWTPLTWCAHYGDYDGTKSLLEKGAYTFWPDHKGFYPLDHCGMQDKTQGGENRNETARILVQNILALIEEFDKDEQVPEMAEKYIDTERFLKTPLLRASTLYWAIYFKLDTDKYVLPLLKCNSIYPEMPVLGANMRNSYHACCAVGNLKALTLLFDSETIGERYHRIVNKTEETALIRSASDRKKKERKEKKENKIVFLEITKEERKNKAYDKEFLQYIKEMSKWTGNFHNQVVKHTIINIEELQPLPYYELQDDFGNTPLHLASFMGHSNVASFLLTKNVDIDIENNDGWRCHEFQQHESIKKAYRVYAEKKYSLKVGESPTTKKSNNKISFQNLGTLALKRAATNKENKENRIVKTSESDLPKAKANNIFKRKIENAFNKALVMQQEERIIPDVVLVFETNKVKEDNKRNNPITNRANFNISLIQTRIDCYLAIGVYEGLFYLMLKMDEKSLDQECYQNKIKVKVLNDYNYVRYDPERKTDFEPFRSRQRQEITLAALGNIVDFNQLKELKVVSSIYPMHTVSGVAKIHDTWIKSEKWYLPEPFSSFTAYFKEGRNLDFSAITSLKMYFGEKFSFYFAWLSFYTCILSLLAVPGIVVYILNRLNPDYASALLPAWVLYSSLVSTLLVERWKRKNAEIATRWGTIDLLNSGNEGSRLRKEYIGDEVISDATGTLTKVNKQNVKRRYYFISFLVFILCSAIVIYSYIWTQNLKSRNTQWILQFLVGAINGVIVAVINFGYEVAARYFADLENHKHQESYEQSLIFKMFTFKAVNSYIGILYLTFVRQVDLDDIFTSLVSLMLTTQGTTIGLSALLPYIQYRLKLKKYKYRVQKRAKRQIKAESDRMLDEISEGETKGKKKGEKPDYVFKRAVLDCRSGGPVEAQWDLTQVELNSMRPEKNDILNYYGSIVVQFGFITMFAVAFPLGPAIAMAVNIIDTKVKIWSSLYIYKRPIAEKSGGIGTWLDAWEVTSIMGVIVNAFTLFFRLQASLGGLENIFKRPGDDVKLLGVPASENINRLWVFVAAVHIILVLKYLIMVFISDKPKWVLNQEEKQRFAEAQALDIKKDHENIIRLRSMGNQDAEFAKELLAKNRKLKRCIAFSAISMASQLEIEAPKPKKKMYHTATSGIVKQRSAKSIAEDVAVVQTTGQGITIPLSRPAINLNQAIKSVLLNTFIHLERGLTLRRMTDVNKLKKEKIIQCFFCNKESSTQFCHDCDAHFCQNCRTQVHDKINSTVHNIAPYDSSQALDAARSQKVSKSTAKIDPLMTSAQNNKGTNTENYWRKFESFNFPVTKGGNFFYQLKLSFQTLYKLYITENSITKENELKDLERALMFRKGTDDTPKSKGNNGDESTDQEDLSGQIDFLYENEIREFLDNDSYNIEEKFFMNKIAYLVFKRRGAETTFDEFFKKIIILQDGSLESKLFLLFDLIDQDDDGNVAREEVEGLFKASFMQSLKLQDEFDSVLKTLFSNNQKINKKTLFQIALKDARMQNLFRTLTQT